jgi:hypothetical protein
MRPLVPCDQKELERQKNVGGLSCQRIVVYMYSADCLSADCRLTVIVSADCRSADCRTTLKISREQQYVEILFSGELGFSVHVSFLVVHP